MKSNIRTIAATFLLIAGIYACNKENNPSYSSQNTSSESRKGGLMLKALFTGKWVVTDFTIDRKPQASDFKGYVFTFYKNGTVQAMKGWSNVGGMWMNAANDNPSEFILNFYDTPVFLQLDAEWHILVLDERVFEMQYVSRTGGSKWIRFEKL